MGRPKGGKNKVWSKEDKYKIILPIISAKKSSWDVTRELHIPHSNIISWIKKYQEGGIEALENKRKPGNPLAKYSCRKELSYTEQLENENTNREWTIKKRIYIKGGGSSKTKEIKQKEYEIIESLSKEYNVESLCKSIELSRSGYYKWLKRKGILNRYQNDRILLCNMIKE